MASSIIQTSAPPVEPITLQEARGFLQLDPDLTQDDALIASVLIPAARAACEHRTGLALITRSFRLQMDCWPGPVVTIERAPLIAVQSIAVLLDSGSWETVPESTYVVDPDSEPGRIFLRSGQVWPLHALQPGSVRVNFTCGHGTSAGAVPAGLKNWMLMRIRGLWEHRAESVEVLRGRMEKPSFVDGLLDPFTITMV